MVAGRIQTRSNRGIVVSGSTITYNNYAHVVPDFGAGGIKFGDTLGAVVRGNTVSYNGGGGIHFDASSSSPLIDGNTVTDNASGSGAAYEISIDSAIVRNNVLLRNALPGTVPVSASDLGSNASVGVNAYCNVVEISAMPPEPTESWLPHPSEATTQFLRMNIW